MTASLLELQVVIRGRGSNFCAGIDLETLGGVAKLMDIEDPARGSASFRRRILALQVLTA